MCGSWLLSIWLSPSQNRAGCCGLSLAASACTRASFGCCCFLLRDASSHAARMHVLRGSVCRFLLGPGVYVQVVRLLAVVPARCTRAPRHQPRSRAAIKTDRSQIVQPLPCTLSLQNARASRTFAFLKVSDRSLHLCRMEG